MQINCIDYIMNEYCAKQIYDSIEKQTKVNKINLENFLISLVYLTKNQIPIGPKASDLKYKLYALYDYQDIDSKFGFDLGAIYGAINFTKIFQDI